jgi:hypothetical protein
MIKIFKRVIRLTAVITLVLFSYSKVCAQDSLRFRYPLDVTMSLSGNYGELRGGIFIMELILELVELLVHLSMQQRGAIYQEL